MPDLGKWAEQKICDWLDRPNDGYSFDRIPDQMTGMYGSRNICDFTCYKYPYFWYIESKATWNDRFDFSMITDYQKSKLLEKSKISGVICVVIILFASYKRAFIVEIQEIQDLIDSGIKSLNIKKIAYWGCKYFEIKTVPNARKTLLDYSGDLPEIHKEGICDENTGL